MLRDSYWRDRAWFVAIGALSLPILIAFGWSEVRYKPIVLPLLGAFFVGGLFLVRALWRTRKIEHEAWVSWVEAKEPFYMAFCECDWLGDGVASEAEARAQALKHTKNVRPGVDRPLA
jgi:hypothetical protein